MAASCVHIRGVPRIRGALKLRRASRRVVVRRQFDADARRTTERRSATSYFV